MSNIDVLKIELKKSLPQLKRLYKMLEEAENDGTYGDSPEDMMYSSLFNKVMDKLVDVLPIVSNINEPVLAEGKLKKNSAGRYAISANHYFTCGSPIEVLVYDDFYDRELWVSSRVEHNGDYYIVGYPNLKLDGLTARIRKYNNPFY